MTPPERRLQALFRNWTPLHSVCLAACVLVASGVLLRPTGPQLPSEDWPKALESLTADQISERLDQLLDQGQAGIPYVVQALECESAETQRICGRAIRESLRRWRLLPAEQAQQRLAVLLQALDRRFADLPPEGQRTANALAGRVADWVYEEPNPRLERLLASNACLTQSLYPTANVSDRLQSPPAFASELPSTMTSITSPPRSLGIAD